MIQPGDVIDPMFAAVLSSNLELGGRVLLKHAHGEYIAAIRLPDDLGKLVGKGPSLQWALVRLSKKIADRMAEAARD